MSWISRSCICRCHGRGVPRECFLNLPYDGAVSSVNNEGLPWQNNELKCSYLWCQFKWYNIAVRSHKFFSTVMRLELFTLNGCIERMFCLFGMCQHKIVETGAWDKWPVSVCSKQIVQQQPRCAVTIPMSDVADLFTINCTRLCCWQGLCFIWTELYCVLSHCVTWRPVHICCMSTCLAAREMSVHPEVCHEY
jgi:hypothetical protein